MTRQGVLVGVDGSPAAADALRWAVVEADRRHVPVTALLAWSYLDQPEGFDPAFGEADAADALAAFVDDALGPDHDVHLRPVCDLPVRAICDAAGAHELVVVGARGAGGFAGLALGSTSYGVLAHSGTPVALVRGAVGTGPVVAGVTEDGAADHVIRAAVDAACRRDGRLVVVSVYDTGAFAGRIFEDDAPYFVRLARKRETFLEELLARVDVKGLKVECRVSGGSAGGTLLQTAADLDASLLVVGNRGLMGVSGRLIGSVSHQIAHHATGAVLLLN